MLASLLLLGSLLLLASTTLGSEPESATHYQDAVHPVPSVIRFALQTACLYNRGTPVS